MIGLGPASAAWHVPGPGWLMRILVLSKYGTLAASTRVRFLQFADHLRASGHTLEVSPLFDDAYLKAKFATGRAPPRQVVDAFLRRLRALVQARRFDLCWVAYELIPYMPPLLEHLLAWRSVPWVVDYDDAIFHMYDTHSKAAVRRALGTKIDTVMRLADGVIAGNAYLAERALRQNPNVTVIPTVVELARYPLRTETPKGTFTVGWIGSPSTSEYLSIVAPALSKLGRQAPLRFIAVGSRPLQIPNVDVEVRPWSQEREAADLHEAHVGIMPIPDTQWARGKCAFKLIQYMACGLPTVSSPVGANREVVTEDTGRFAEDEAEWVQALETLRDDPALRDKLGRAGHERVKAQYCVEAQKQAVLEALERAAHGR